MIMLLLPLSIESTCIQYADINSRDYYDYERAKGWKGTRDASREKY